MKHLWAPWRIRSFTQPKTGCAFCSIQEEPDGPGNLVVWRSDSALVVLNRYPYTSGHVLVIAREHISSLEGLTPACRAEMMELATRCMTLLRAVYQPDGFNLGANIGGPAGAAIPGHVHLHIVPRWSGDTHFMTVLDSTRVLPEALEETYRRFRQAWSAQA